MKGSTECSEKSVVYPFLFLQHARSLPGKLFEVGKLGRRPPWAGVASEPAGRYLTPPVRGHRPWKCTNIQFPKF